MHEVLMAATTQFHVVGPALAVNLAIVPALLAIARH